jgi:hypothetical protein
MPGVRQRIYAPQNEATTTTNLRSGSMPSYTPSVNKAEQFAVEYHRWRRLTLSSLCGLVFGSDP